SILDTAVFNAANPTDILFNSTGGAHQITFNPGAAAYTITVSSPTPALVVFQVDGGFTNNSTNTQTFINNVNTTIFNSAVVSGPVVFHNGVTGNMAFGNFAAFQGTSIINDGTLSFGGQANVVSGTIINNAGAGLSLSGNAGLTFADVTNNGTLNA